MYLADLDRRRARSRVLRPADGDAAPAAVLQRAMPTDATIGAAVLAVTAALAVQTPGASAHARRRSGGDGEPCEGARPVDRRRRARNVVLRTVVTLSEVSVRRPSTALAVLGSALLLAACGGGSHDDHEGSATGPAGAATATTAAAPESGADGATAAAGTPNAADVAFAQGMIPHHEQAVAMSEIALDPAVGAGPEVTDLATRIRAAQDPEIATMRGWLTAWGEEEIAEDHAAHGMEGMMSADELARLEQLEGAEFDRTWMEMMIRHHRGAITMSETVKQEGSLDAVEALADTIIAAQQKEIDEMQGLLDR